VRNVEFEKGTGALSCRCYPIGHGRRGRRDAGQAMRTAMVRPKVRDALCTRITLFFSGNTA